MLKKKPLSTVKPAAAAPASAASRKGAASASAATEPDTDTEASEEASPSTKTKTKVEAAPNTELVTLFTAYDVKVEEAESAFIDLVEHIQKNQIDRSTVIASMMKARGITFESAQKQYSNMKKIFNNEEVLADLKAGKITLKVAREKATNKQKNPASAKPEAKEAKFTNSLKTFVAAAKESGFSRREIMVTVEAELKSAGIK